MADYEAAIAPVKECLFGELLDSLGDGQPHWEKVGGGGGLHSLLEVGIGTGPNFKYYSQASTSAGLAITGAAVSSAVCTKAVSCWRQLAARAAAVLFGTTATDRQQLWQNNVS